jgi:hypothetical protein
MCPMPKQGLEGVWGRCRERWANRHLSAPHIFSLFKSYTFLFPSK